MYTVKILNSRNKFDVGVCSTKEELIKTLELDLDYEYAPSNIMSICTSPRDSDPSGIGAKPTIRIVIKITINNIFVTLGSVHRIMKESDNKVWYALPMFDGKKRRIGNISGITGSSMNHCQLPGFTIYKLYTKNEIINRVKVKQELSDYPIGVEIDDEILVIDEEIFTLNDLYDVNEHIELDSKKFAEHLVSDIKRLKSGDELKIFEYESDPDSDVVDLDYVEDMNSYAAQRRRTDMIRERMRESIIDALRSGDIRSINALRAHPDMRVFIDELIAEHRDSLNVDSESEPEPESESESESEPY